MRPRLRLATTTVYSTRVEREKSEERERDMSPPSGAQGLKMREGVRRIVSYMDGRGRKGVGEGLIFVSFHPNISTYLSPQQINLC